MLIEDRDGFLNSEVDDVTVTNLRLLVLEQQRPSIKEGVHLDLSASARQRNVAQSSNIRRGMILSHCLSENQGSFRD
jgi:hypothetical protein